MGTSRSTYRCTKVDIAHWIVQIVKNTFHKEKGKKKKAWLILWIVKYFSFMRWHNKGSQNNSNYNDTICEAC